MTPKSFAVLEATDRCSAKDAVRFFDACSSALSASFPAIDVARATSHPTHAPTVASTTGLSFARPWRGTLSRITMNSLFKNTVGRLPLFRSIGQKPVEPVPEAEAQPSAPPKTQAPPRRNQPRP